LQATFQQQFWPFIGAAHLLVGPNCNATVSQPCRVNSEFARSCVQHEHLYTRNLLFLLISIPSKGGSSPGAHLLALVLCRLSFRLHVVLQEKYEMMVEKQNS
jgi:hypothetical protein